MGRNAVQSSNWRLARPQSQYESFGEKKISCLYVYIYIYIYIYIVELHLFGRCYPDRLGPSGKHFLTVIELHLFYVLKIHPPP